MFATNRCSVDSVEVDRGLRPWSAPGAARQPDQVEPHADDRRSSRHPIVFLIIFLVAIAVAGVAGRALDGAEVDATAPGPGQLLWLVTPLAAAVALTTLRRRRDRRAGRPSPPWGLRPRFATSWPWYLFAALVFPATTVVLVGIGDLVDTVIVEPELAMGAVVAAVAIAIPASFVKNLFEELVWRGYLTAELDDRSLSPLQVHVVVGVVWGLWHLPYLDSFSGIYHDLRWPVYGPLFLAGVVVTAVIYGEVRRRSGTVWPAVVMHTMANATVNTLFLEEHIRLDSDRPWLVAPAVDNVGYLVLVALIATALVIGRSRPPTPTGAHH